MLLLLLVLLHLLVAPLNEVVQGGLEVEHGVAHGGGVEVAEVELLDVRHVAVEGVEARLAVALGDDEQQLTEQVVRAELCVGNVLVRGLQVLLHAGLDELRRVLEALHLLQRRLERVQRGQARHGGAQVALECWRDAEGRAAWVQAQRVQPHQQRTDLVQLGVLGAVQMAHPRVHAVVHSRHYEAPHYLHHLRLALVAVRRLEVQHLAEHDASRERVRTTRGIRAAPIAQATQHKKLRLPQPPARNVQ
jgi:hypothetical protein